MQFSMPAFLDACGGAVSSENDSTTLGSFDS
jgi:hypothetical protein